MADVLKLCDGVFGYYIAWFVDGEECARVGDFADRIEKLASEVDAQDTIIAERVAHQRCVVDECTLSDGSYKWASHAAAKRALQHMKSEIKAAKSGRVPEPWEQQAIDAGWKPPKGWK